MAACYHGAPGFAALVMVALGLGGCSSPARATRTAPETRVTERRLPAPLDREPAVWAGLAELAASEPLTAEPQRSPDHLDGEHLAFVRIAPAARDAYLQLTADTVLPDGTVILESLFKPQAGIPVEHGPWFAMRKAAAGWSFAVRPPGGALRELEAGSLCERCHAEAPNDYVYGLSRRRHTP